MPAPKRKIHKALWKNRNSGHLLLSEPWAGQGMPEIELDGRPVAVQAASAREEAQFTGYLREEGELVFVLHALHYPRTDLNDAAAYVAGSFNGWEEATDNPKWKLQAVDAENWQLRLPAEQFHENGPHSFKFITGDGQWLEPPATAPNRHSPWKGVANLRLDPGTDDTRMLHFRLTEDRLAGTDAILHWHEPGHSESCTLPRPIALPTQQSAQPLGAHISEDSTTFRLFAPRAENVTVTFWPEGQPDAKVSLTLKPDDDRTWAAQHPANLDGHRYIYHVGGTNHDATTEFNAEQPLTDPYAVALASASGPGIVMEPSLAPGPRFTPPSPEDLQIVEVHLRDVLAEAPLELSGPERRGFPGLARWLRTGDTYLHRLGTNAVELLPVHEFDCDSPHEYHWGYMPVNLFSPASSYAQSPAAGSQIAEFQDLVRAFHEEKFAVILDVVLNHQGIHTPLHGIDKGYYFEMDDSQELLNWSGCGNDMRSNAPMVRRLLVDSLLHWVRVYDVDGFRLDLAELLDLETLTAIETTLRQEKPDIILIAEPWSFRGHSAKVLRSTSYSSWNDGFREFVFRYVLGKGTSKDLAYFLGGSQGHFATFPAQTVNYIESHDDRCWIDKITENKKHDGRQPTTLDIHRTHLAIGILHVAFGIPMLSAGQDFLRSKHGVKNTYRRGDLNILDYDRENKFQKTVEYIRAWIRFRQSIPGNLLRRKTFPNPTNLRFFHSDDGLALAMHLWDDDRHLLFTIHPTVNPAEIHLLEDLPELWLVADEKRFYERDSATYLSGKSCVPLKLPPGSLRLWAAY